MPVLLSPPLLALVLTFLSIHQIVRFFQKIIQGMAAGTVRIGTDAGVDRVFFFGYFIVFTDSLINAAHSLPGARLSIPAQKCDQKLVAPDPGSKLLIQTALDDTAQAVQRLIPLRVSICIVDLLESVHIQRDDGQLLIPRCLQQLIYLEIKTVAVIQSCEKILHIHLHKLFLGAL